jgi:Spy/CpxP family protein refolding chaperone
MRKSAAVAVALAFAGITFAQQAQSGSSQGQYPTGGPKHYKEWCRQNWEKCKQMKLERLSAKKECLEKSQSYEAFRNCMAQFREQRRQEMKGLKQD